MSRRAWAYIWMVLLAGAGASALLFVASPLPSSQGPVVAAFTLLATLTQLLKTEVPVVRNGKPGSKTYFATLVFISAAVLLLHPFFLVPVVVVSYGVEWAKERLLRSPNLRNWYLQPFNIAMAILAGSAAHLAYTLVNPNPGEPFTFLALLGVAMAALVYVGANQVLLGMALVLARGTSWREAMLDTETMQADLIHFFLGYVVAVLWQLNPWLILPALAPLALTYRSLAIPQLKQEAHLDGKTGLWNARRFNQLANEEVERATRLERKLAVIMADLDLLRNINNTYGHLAGDTVLTGIGQVIRQTIRESDIAGRFGGEEFCIVLTNVEQEQARAAAERLRQAIEATPFEISTSPTPIHVTMSLGVACFPRDGTTLTGLTQQADVAVYQAKLRGRNCVAFASDVPRSLPLESDRAGEHVETSYAAAHMIQSAPTTAGAASVEGQEIEPQSRAARLPSAKQEKPGTSPLLPSRALPLFVGGVIALGAAQALAGMALHPSAHWLPVAVLTALAAGTEFAGISAYGQSTVSVSMAITFAAALLTGVPGVAATSAAIVLAHAAKTRPQWYQTAFNWATHVLAGSVPWLVYLVLASALQGWSPVVVQALTVASGLGYYAVETGLVTVAIGLSQRTEFKSTWHSQFRWLATHYLALSALGMVVAIAYGELGFVGLMVFILPLFMMQYAQHQYVERTQESMRELRRMNQELARANQEVLGASQAIRHFNDELFMTLAKIIDARDPFAGSHASQVAKYAVAMATELGMQGEPLEALRQAALLHDIGKLGISERILNKPGRLDEREYAVVKKHASLGSEFLETCGSLRHLALSVRYHHERWDGCGYPDGLCGEQIPLEARLLAISDAVDVMASDRPYRRAMSPQETMVELRASAGTQFDPALVEVFAGIVEREGESFIVNSADDGARRQAARQEGRSRSTGVIQVAAVGRPEAQVGA